MLDAVEHRGETLTIVRRGEVIAQLEPARTTSGARKKPFDIASTPTGSAR
jgi:antitoxin (DNA-binding transcriptional repressor) of toxin-antitoxin stability system